jgi:hypothetical protein
MNYVLLVVAFFTFSPLALAVRPTDKKVTPAPEPNVVAPALIGGEEVDEDELLGSVFLTIGGSRCTGSVVGEQVILTAGHCLDDDEENATFGLGRQRLRARCERHPDFDNNNLNNDFALCKTNVRMRNIEQFIDLSPVNVQVNNNVVMQGFGQNDVGTLQAGRTRIVQIDNQDLITNSTVLLGSGDSGGCLIQGNPDLEDEVLRCIGVNSRVSRNADRQGRRFSFFNRINLNRTQDFFEDFADDNNVDICGVNTSCRVRNRAADLCDFEEAAVRAAEDELDRAEDALDQCVDQKVKLSVLR